MDESPRLAVRALIRRDDTLLLVNAYKDGRARLWCAPGGGVRRGTSLHENLIREVHEETGLTIAVGELALVNEFHDPRGTFHQVELFFHATVAAGLLSDDWRDPEGVVSQRQFFTRAELARMRVKPDALIEAAFAPGPAVYDPLEPILR